MILLAACSTWHQTTTRNHTLKVTFDYDFSLTPACSTKVTKNCVQQFNVYDLSPAFNPLTKLFSIPADPSATGMVRGITGTSPLLPLRSGKHLISVVAQTPDNVESNNTTCTTWIEVP